MPTKTAIKTGAIALFGERYPENVEEGDLIFGMRSQIAPYFQLNYVEVHMLMLRVRLELLK